MSSADKVFTGGIPAIYERCMVPMLFEPYAQDMAARVASLAPRKILEIAAGTGVVTRAMAAKLDSGTEIVATDLNQPMLDAAAGLMPAGSHVTFRQADAQALPFGDASFDVVICQFGAMFFPDKPLAYREALRVLKPGGTYIFSVWDKLAANDFVTVAQALLVSRFPDDPPRFMERVPHGYHDAEAIAGVVREAGFAHVVAETVEKIAHAQSALDAATGYCQGNPLRVEIEAREPGGLQAVTDAVAIALAERFGRSAIEGKISARVITARK